MKSRINIIIIAFLVFTGINLYSQTVGKTFDGAGNVADAGTVFGVTGALDHAVEITSEHEYFIGRAVAANILSTYNIWDKNPALTSYLNRICAAITINSPLPNIEKPNLYNGCHVAILDSSEINAFATPGGHIFVTRGLVSAAKSEDALAAVIAHEVAHIQLRHGIEVFKGNRAVAQAFAVNGAAEARILGLNELTNIFGGAVWDVFNTMKNSGYPKRQEFEADKTAMNLLACAGYNPQGLIDILRELNTVQREASLGLSRTHPAPADRITEAQQFINGFTVTDNSSLRQLRFETVSGANLF